MITIMAQNIKNGGGLELLLYLIEYVSTNYKDQKFIVYVDQSLTMLHSNGNVSIVHVSGVMNKVKLFTKYINNVLYFGNLPPLVKNKKSIVYLHNLYLLMEFNSLVKEPKKIFLKYFLQKNYIKLFIRNVDKVACQNDYVETNIHKIYGAKVNTIKLPFFRIDTEKDDIKKQYDFCYISLAHPHKNHMRLLNACEVLAKKNIQFSLVLTVEKEEKNKIILDKIKLLNEQHKGVKIINLGKISKNEVNDIYSKTHKAIFPSLKETFGLGLIEAAHMGLDVLASDLPYTYEAIEPSYIFNPLDVQDMANKMESSLVDEKIKPTKNKIENKIDVLINSLIDKGSYYEN